MWITRIPLVLMSGFYRDSIWITKKENQDSIGITKTTEKWLWDSIWIPKKRNEKLFEDSIFFPDSSGFFGILQDSDTSFGHICSSAPPPSKITKIKRKIQIKNRKNYGWGCGWWSGLGVDEKSIFVKKVGAPLTLESKNLG